jgi:hypothetical protein
VAARLAISPGRAGAGRCSAGSILTPPWELARLRIAEHWHWVIDLVAAFDRLAALPRPVI